MTIRVLYLAYRNDPRNMDDGSSADYGFYSALANNGFNVEVLGPFSREAVFLERAVRRFYHQMTGRRYLKFPLSLVRLASRALTEADRHLKPDVILTLFPASLVFYKGNTPCVYRSDSTQIGWQNECNELGKLALRVGIWQEKRAIQKSAKIITHSDWNKHILQSEYGVNPEKIELFPNPAALPESVIPTFDETLRNKKLSTPVRLLFVGRVKERKGLDTAIDIVNRLNDRGCPAHLTVCGLFERNQPNVTFVGLYRKGNPKALREYISFYSKSHFLLHPTRFDPSPIVTSEAAAFGVPTITNDVGGVGTSVKNGESGIVLPKVSTTEAYTNVILDLISKPLRYHKLCLRTRSRYDRELNWQIAGKRVANVLKEVLNHQKDPGRSTY